MASGSTTFDEHVQHMRHISEGNESFGDGSAYEQATRYYLTHLIDDCAELARRAVRGLPRSVDLLISMAGFSPRTTILAYKTLRPRRLVVIPSENARSSYNTIAAYVHRDGLELADVTSRVCIPTDPLSIYRIVKDELENHTRLNGSSGVAYIDITGGRKVMSATAALAAWQLNLGLCYLDGDYDPGLKQAIPGSDRLLLLDNPTSLFGEQEMRAAENTFDGGAFEAARLRFEQLAARLAQPARARFMMALSALYRAWCDLDLLALPAAISAVEENLRPLRTTASSRFLSAIEAQLNFLQRLADGDRSALLLGFHLLDDHYRRLGRLDFAALFSYRTIEGCLLNRLANTHPGFDGENPDYDLLTSDVPGLRGRYRSVVNEVDGQVKSRSLPPSVGVFAGAVLLHVLTDPLASAAELDDADSLRLLRNGAQARNKSVLAHGYQAVDVEASAWLNDKATVVLSAYWNLQHTDQDIDRQRNELRFLRATELN
ncbi:TIGR02710 family CRISPR-associated CARF protein [Amycolatopsis sp. Hca4]|uniref:TIGR02710 family CRISPR-associated CARF protein n=1 Tax=Amycolatopsis sp. Hca4 TaxID=2742131 RepID=UPI0015909A3C|nr:TIGR02710 family CRISPR-associated CARF protein [Amycolatopsis sp. Hca4]QKV78173.1 TIGR02710 family CRISPR-associated protein [Amycolatopsis sp. Hca4]